MRNKTMLYLAEFLTYGVSNPIKVGIAKDIKKRMRGLRDMGITHPLLLGYFLFETRREAIRLETMICRRFKPCERHGHLSRELLAASEEEILGFVKSYCDIPFIKAQRLF